MTPLLSTAGLGSWVPPLLLMAPGLLQSSSWKAAVPDGSPTPGALSSHPAEPARRADIYP